MNSSDVGKCLIILCVPIIHSQGVLDVEDMRPIASQAQSKCTYDFQETVGVIGLNCFVCKVHM